MMAIVSSWVIIIAFAVVWIAKHGILTTKEILPTFLAGAFLVGLGIVLAFVTEHRLIDVLTLKAMDWMTGFTIGVGYVCFVVSLIGLIAIPFPCLRRIAEYPRSSD